MKLFLPLVCVASAALSGRANEIRYAPADGTLVRRTFASESEYTLEEVEVTFGGESPPGVPEPDLSIHSRERIVVADEVLEVEDGRPLRLRRTFEELNDQTTFHSDSQDEDLEQEQVSDLEGSTVLFAWDADEEEYSVTAAEDEVIDGDLLEGLVEDMDFRLLLPDGEVEEGASWEVDPELVLTLMWPGGFPGFYEEEAGEIDWNQRAINLEMIDALDGEGSATYEGTRDEDGVTVAVIRVELDVSSGGSVDVEREDGGEVTRAVTLSRRIEGEVLWNAELGLMHSLSMAGETELVMTTSATVESPDGEVEFEQRQVFNGSNDYTVTFEVEGF